MAHSFIVGAWTVEPDRDTISSNGTSIHLEPKVMEVLVRLAESPGETISKDDLIKSVWPDTFVGDDVLSRSVYELRKAFGDDTHEPHIIQTIPKRGYRLIAPVHGMEPAAPPAEAAPAKRVHRKLYVVAAFLLVLIVAGAFYYFPRKPALTEKDFILLADFVNTTGDPVFDDTLKQALATQLEQSPYLNIVPEQNVRETLKYMDRSQDEKLTESVAREVCQRENIKAMLTGSIAPLGSQYVIALHAVNCGTGESLAREQITASAKEKVLPAVSKASTGLRKKLGESLASIQKFDKPIEQATTSSLEALQAFTRGTESHLKDEYVESSVHFQRAIELDPNFAFAHTLLAVAYRNVGEWTRSMESMQRAYALRDRVSERERLYIDMYFHWIVTGDIDKETESERLFSQTYPREIEPLTNLASTYVEDLGEYEKGIETGNRALKLNPRDSSAYAVIVDGYLGLNRFDEARRALEEGLSKYPESIYFHLRLYWVAFLRGDQAGMLREREWAADKVEASFISGGVARNAAAQQGKLKQSRELMAEGTETARVHGFKNRASGFVASQALTEAEVGNFKKAQELAKASMSLSQTRTNLPTIAVALALAADKSGSQRILNDLNKQFPFDTYINLVYGPCAQAVMQGTDPAKSTVRLQGARRYELSTQVRFLPNYVRGLTYLRGGLGNAAASEFQRIIDHRGSSPATPEHALAHLGLARAYSLAGDKSRSLKAYEEFLTLWKDADPDVPLLGEAKAEYAKMKSQTRGDRALN
jgi:DNA-binding winged helix-turn-helix (wHTH) protein/tetratricopeptide (TPR) repeat protein